MDSKQILNTSYEAARYVTNIEGWVDSQNRFWGKDEKMARWSGCTHIICPKCGRPTPKNYTICENCREEKAIERYNLKERRKWDGKTPLYSEATKEYFFFDEGSIDCHFAEYLKDREYLFRSLRLVICEPIPLRQIDEEYFCDDLPEDGDIPDEVASALEDLNRIIRDQKPVSWEPGKYAAIL